MAAVHAAGPEPMMQTGWWSVRVGVVGGVGVGTAVVDGALANKDAAMSLMEEEK